MSRPGRLLVKHQQGARLSAFITQSHYFFPTRDGDGVESDPCTIMLAIYFLSLALRHLVLTDWKN